MKAKKLAVSLMTLSLVAGTAVPMSDAAERDWWNRYDNNRYGNNSRGFLEDRPYVKKALIGGAIGAVAGGVITRNSDTMSGAIKGAALGAAAGLGYEYLRRKGF